jgi:transposase
VDHFNWPLTQHLQCKDKKDSDRLKAVLLRSEEWTVPKISQALRVHQTTIIRHINEYHEGKLKNESGGSDSKLDESQTEELIAHLEAHTYHHVHEIILFINDKWGVRFSIPGMNKWLHRHDFSYKKPKGFPHKANPKLQEEFITEYEKLKSEVGVEEPILFMDAVHPTQATKLSYGWIRTGQTKHVETTGSRTRLNIVGAIQLGNIAETMTAQYETINGEPIRALA